MHKKIEAELVSLANSILQMKNKDDVSILHKKAQDICEKLSVLKYVDAYMNTISTIEVSKEEIVDKITPVVVEEKIEEPINIVKVLVEVEETAILSETEVEEIFGIEDTLLKDDVKNIPSLQNSLEEELKDAISADAATQMFERVTKENPVIENVQESTQRSLNDTLFKNNIQVGLNDRIAFVKYLFEGNQEDFNRVLSQLNSFKTEEEAKDFISTMVKPEYDWRGNEEYEQRFTNLIERKFS
tara:strand:+ start:41729 stop:42457 length:729 start_codon:yes stop_codon:yes gene_type:complete